jgi:iron complex transport system substrate-binding protein
MTPAFAVRMTTAAAILLVAASGVDAQQTRTITDMAGRAVTISAKVEKVATIGSVPVINSFIFAAGAGDRIINGLPDFARSPRWRYQTVFAPGMAGKPMMQSPDRAPEIEKLLEARPDVVFTMDRPVADQLAAHALPAVFLAWREPEDVKTAMALVADILGVPDAANRYAQYFDDAIARAAHATAAAGATRPKVLYLAAATLQQPHLIVEWWIKAAGGISVTDDGRKTEARTVTMEQILAWNPDVLILNSPSDLNVIAKDHRFSAVKAVAEKRVYLTPVGAHVWANRTIENPLTVLWAAKLFQPGVFADLDIEREVQRFYESFFKTRLTGSQVSEILSGRP